MGRKIFLLGLVIASVASLMAPATAVEARREKASLMVHPGAYVGIERGFCTLNFLFKGTDRRNYIGTAGHCVAAEPGQEVIWPKNEGPIATNVDGVRIGEFAYAVHFRPDAQHDYWQDFALIRLDKGIPVAASLPQVGGPTEISNEISQQPMPIHYYGQGTGFGTVAPGRSGLLPRGTGDKHEVWGLGAVNPGDSGSPVIDDEGKAIGVFTGPGVESNLFSPQDSDGGTMNITRLPFQIDLAQVALGIRLTLRTAEFKS